MKIIVDRETLYENISKVTKVAAQVKVSSILECVLIEAENVVVFTTNNMKIQLQTEFNAKIYEKGTALVKAKLLADIVKSLPDGNVEISSDKDQLIVKSNNVEFKLPCLQTTEYPKMARKATESYCVFSTDDFANAVERVIFAVSKDETKPVFTGVLFEKEDEKVNVVAMDGHRLALCKITPLEAEGDFSKIIPCDGLENVLKIIDIENNAETVKMSFYENQVVFEVGSTTAIINLITGRFFNYKSVIPNSYTTKIQTSVEIMEDVLERAKIIAQGIRTGPPVVILNVVENALKVTTQSPDGDYSEDVTCTIEGDPLRMGFNVKYLLDVLKRLEGEIELQFTGEIQPCVVNKKDRTDYIYLVLPVKIPE